ncbi:MAG: sprT domain-containing protein [Flavobacteriales bacterium]|nr:MAG: sprT domain-containing protein [Flavobacteriales bacterium]
MREILLKYVPEPAVDRVIDLLHKYPCKLRIVKNRKTKHGDFKQLKTGQYQITINNDLNKYRFLLTLVHEVAHLVTYKENSIPVKPHGKEWKQNFKILMIPFLDPEIYPEELLRNIANYLINPKASTDSDVNLSLILKSYDEKNGKYYIFELEDEVLFTYENRTFKLGKKRRTRYECTEVKTKKKYLFHQNAAVEIIKKYD